MADRDKSILLRLQSEGRSVPSVELREAESGGDLSVREVSLRESGRFQVLGEIAAGGVGQVLKGRDVDLGRDVALKVIHEKHLGTEHVLQRFIEEAQIGGQLQHPGIVPVYELGLQADKRPFFAMKLVKGQTLAKMLADRGDPSEDRRRFLSVFEEVCQTVGYAHSRGVIHRDLKPANVMVGAFGEVQVLDWGFAKVMPRGGIADERASRMKTPDITEIATVRSLGEGSESIPGSIMGTLAYMPPEQAMGQVEALDERSDVFSLGAILTEILTGAPPYTSQGRDLLIEAAQCRLEDAHRRLDGSGAEETLVDLAKRCLSPLGVDRPKNAAELAEVVHAHLALAEERARKSALTAAESRAEAERADQEARDQRRVRRLGMTLAAAVLVALLVGGGGLLWIDNGKREREERARTAVTAAMNEAQRLRGEERWTEALRAAEQAGEFAAAEEVDAETRGRARSLLTAVSEEAAEARAVAEQEAKDRALLAELEEIRLESFDEHRSPWARDEGYSEAFRRYGLGIWDLDPIALGERIRGRGVAFATEIAAALDDWSGLRRTGGFPYRGNAERLSAVAAACDPDPKQRRLRELLARDDVEGLTELVSEEGIQELPVRSLVKLGYSLWARGRAEEAISLLEGACLRHPGDLWVHYATGWAYRASNRFENALSHFTAVLAIRPESVAAHTVLGALLCDRLRDYDAAESVFREAIRLDPECAIAHFDLGNALRGQGRDEEAIAAFREAIRLEPDYAAPYSNMGCALTRLGRIEEAIEAIQTCLRLDPANAEARSSLAVAFREQGRLEEALAAHREALRLAPELGSVHGTFGNTLVSAGRYEEAVAAHRRAAELDPETPDHPSNLSIALRHLGRYDEAVAACRRALELDPNFAKAHLNLGEALAGKGRLEEAMRAFEEAARLDPQFAPPELQLGNICYELGVLDKAAEAYRAAIRKVPEDAVVHLCLGNTLLRLGRDDLAVDALKEAVRLDPGSIQARLNLGSTLNRLGRSAEAAEITREAIRLDPEHTGLRQSLGLALAALGQDDEALESFREASRLEPGSADARIGVGNMLLRKGQLAEAVDAYRRAIELDPSNCIAYSNLGAALDRLGRPEQAERAFRKAIDLNPENPLVRYNLGSRLLRQGRLEEAITSLREAVRLNPGYAMAYYDLGNACFRMGSLEEAVAAFQEAIRLAPGLSGAHNNLGVVLQAQGDFERAIEAHREAIRVDPENAEAHLSLGRALQARGKWRDALEALRRARELGAGRANLQMQSAAMIRAIERRVALADRLPAILAGEDAPADAAERILLGEVSHGLGRYSVAVRFYVDAFSEDATLLIVHRYNAACSAARGGAGVAGADVSLDESARSEMRRRALMWLREDLEARRKALPAMQLISILQHWLRDPDLTGVRDEAEIERLPEEERSSWRELWAEVREALKQAGAAK